MASSTAATHPIRNTQLAHGCHLASKPASCCDLNQPRPESLQCNDASKRKRVNRTAKLKQCKRDARREQWLSQGKQQQCQNACSSISDEKNCDPGETGDEKPVNTILNLENNTGKDKSYIRPAASSGGAVHELPPPNACEGNDQTARSLIRTKRPESKVGCADGGSMQELSVGSVTDYDDSTSSTTSCMSDCSEADSSPKACEEKSPKSKVTKLGRHFESGRTRLSSKPGEKFPNSNLKRKDTKNSENVSGNQNPDPCGDSSASSCYSGSGNEGNGHSHDSEDDWEAAADALNLQPSSPSKDPYFGSVDSSITVAIDRPLQSVWAEENKSTNTFSKSKCNRMSSPQEEKFRSFSGKAWRPDDSSRPSSLPNLMKQQSLPTKHNKQAWDSTQKVAWVPHPAPSHCPICTEELDSTDSSFIPCSCGFRLCLFCHHRIVLEDGRCPGCRKAYNADVAMKLSCSQNIGRRV